MTAIQKEADEYIHLMRQSKMDSIRDYIERQIRLSRSPRVSLHEKDEAKLALRIVRKMFTETSQTA